MTQETSVIQHIHNLIINNDIDSLNKYRMKFKEAKIAWDSILFMEITPLLRAVSVGADDVIEMLLSEGSDINLASKRGKNAFSYAKSSSIKKLLLKHILKKKFLESKNLRLIEDLIDAEDLESLKAIYDKQGNDLSILERNFLLFAAVQLRNSDLFTLITHNLSFDQLNELISHDSESITEIENFIRLLFSEGRLILAPIITSITPDGDCMYVAILNEYNKRNKENLDLMTLRKMVAGFLDNNKNILISRQLLQIILDKEINGVTDETLKIVLKNLSDSFREGLLTQDEIMQLINLYNLPQLYTKAILERGNWGDNLQLTIISKILGLSIIIHNLDGTTININNSGTDNTEEVHLLFNGDHYDLISGFIYNAPHILYFTENLGNENVTRAIEEEHEAYLLMQYPTYRIDKLQTSGYAITEQEVINILGAAVIIGCFMHIWESNS